MTLIRALFLDLDETLIQDVNSTAESVAKCVPVLQEKHPALDASTIEQQFHEINNWHWENFDDSPIGSMPEPLDVRAFVWGKVLEALQISDDALARRLAETFQNARGDTYRCYDDTHEVLSILQSRVPLILVTNGNQQMQRAKIAACNVEPYFDRIVIAQEFGVSKPDPAIFREALSYINVPAENVLMVGDNWNKDIIGGMNAGTQTAWIQRREAKDVPGDQPPTYIVRTMTEVREIIERQYV